MSYGFPLPTAFTFYFLLFTFLMIPFRPLTIEDRPTVLKYTMTTTRRNCYLSFSNLYSWSSRFLTEIAELGGYLLMRYLYAERTTYLMPVGEGDIKPVIEALMSDATEQGDEFRLIGVCAEMRAKLEAAFPDRFEFLGNRDYFDYVYLRSDLAELKGKKFQPKRNHINKFKAEFPDYVYKPLTPDLVPECLRLEKCWWEANNGERDQDLQDERQAMTRAMNHIDELGIIGGTLWVEDHLVAFTFGCPINQDTFDTCVEKACTDYDGAYAMINYEFARRLPEHFVYINREEDLGIEGLRKAKLSYHPVILLEKYAIKVKSEE